MEVDVRVCRVCVCRVWAHWQLSVAFGEHEGTTIAMDGAYDVTI